MAPYDPPRSTCHYTELDVKNYDENMILCMIGKGGEGFYKLTNYLKMSYVWYDNDRKVIELWGPYYALKNGAKSKLEQSLDKFKLNFVPKEINNE